MLKTKRTWLIALSLALIGGISYAQTEHRLTDKNFRELHQLIQPQADEQKWMQIPWMASLWEARRKAAAEGKPILLWEMDGHPLGCT